MRRARTATLGAFGRRGRSRAQRRQRGGALAVAAAALALSVSGCALAPDTALSPAPAPSARQSSPSPSPSPLSTPEPAPSASPRAPGASAIGVVPARVSLPTIGVDAPLIDLGILPDGSLEVPADFDDIGWFTGGGKPGGRGPTVVAAHVDSPSGPAAFVRLDELDPGDRVILTGVDGAEFEYEVYHSATYAKAEFPTTEVFGAVRGDEVRLITCTGLFDTAIGHYDDNLVVSAARVLPD